jgi:hypothetical protein
VIFGYLCNMKALFLILFSIITVYITAQSANDTFNTAYYLPGNVNVTVSLIDTGSITGDVWRFTDSSLRIYGRTNAGDMAFININYTEMHSVKIKRYAFLQGAFRGGKIADKVLNFSDAAYDIKAEAGVLAAIASAAVIGGTVKSVATKKKFKIKGKKQNFEEVFEILVQAQPQY